MRRTPLTATPRRRVSGMREHMTCAAWGAGDDVNLSFRSAGVQSHATLAAVRATVRRADWRHLATTGVTVGVTAGATTGVTTATHRPPQLVQLTGKRGRTHEPGARICSEPTQPTGY